MLISLRLQSEISRENKLTKYSMFKVAKALKMALTSKPSPHSLWGSNGGRPQLSDPASVLHALSIISCISEQDWECLLTGALRNAAGQ